jgi:thioredoxin reductase (NADPH)
MNIIIYTKTGCPWCIGALTYLREEGIPFEERNVTENQTFFDEMIAKSNQSKAPTLDIEGEIFGDVGKEEIEVILRDKGIVK